MKIHIDFVHLPNVNLFKNLIRLLDESGHEIVFTVQKRGRLPKILDKEIPGYKRKVFGRHRGTLYSIFVESNIIRFFYMFLFILRNKPDIALNAGSFPQMISSWFLRIKSITISDDPERKHDFMFFDIFATQVLFPPIIESKGKYRTFKALKEWAYLSPDYFTPDESTLKPYNLIKKKYLFFREVSVGSVNYAGQESGLISKFAEEIPKEIPVILSLENKDTRHLYPDHWILLQEPVDDIHSLMYYSAVVVSSGDSMAREGAMLGNPSVYCGIREMKANNILIKIGLLHKLPPTKVPDYINKLLNNHSALKQEAVRKKLQLSWDDVNAFILNIIQEQFEHKYSENSQNN